MNLEDRVAILKMAGYEVREVPEYKTKPDEYYAWVIEKGKGTLDHYIEVDDDLAHIVEDAWYHYEESQR